MFQLSGFCSRTCFRKVGGPTPTCSAAVKELSLNEVQWGYIANDRGSLPQLFKDLFFTREPFRALCLGTWKVRARMANQFQNS